MVVTLWFDLGGNDTWKERRRSVGCSGGWEAVTEVRSSVGVSEEAASHCEEWPGPVCPLKADVPRGHEGSNHQGYIGAVFGVCSFC